MFLFITEGLKYNLQKKGTKIIHDLLTLHFIMYCLHLSVSFATCEKLYSFFFFYWWIILTVIHGFANPLLQGMCYKESINHFNPECKIFHQLPPPGTALISGIRGFMSGRRLWICSKLCLVPNTAITGSAIGSHIHMDDSEVCMNKSYKHAWVAALVFADPSATASQFASHPVHPNSLEIASDPEVQGNCSPCRTAVGQTLRPWHMDGETAGTTGSDMHLSVVPWTSPCHFFFSK